MGNLRKRAPTWNGNWHNVGPASTRRNPSLELKRLPRHRNEDKSEATARAMREPWWPRVVHRIPVMSSGVWCWQVRPA